jgi:hypothetical protein
MFDIYTYKIVSILYDIYVYVWYKYTVCRFDNKSVTNKTNSGDFIKWSIVKYCKNLVLVLGKNILSNKILTIRDSQNY